MTPEITISYYESYYKDKSEIKNMIENSIVFSEEVKPALIQMIDSDTSMGVIMDAKYGKQIPISIKKKELTIIR